MNCTTQIKFWSSLVLEVLLVGGGGGGGGGDDMSHVYQSVGLTYVT